MYSCYALACDEALPYSCFTEIFHCHFAYVILLSGSLLLFCSKCWPTPPTHSPHLQFQEAGESGLGGKQLSRGLTSSLETGLG